MNRDKIALGTVLAVFLLSPIVIIGTESSYVTRMLSLIVIYATLAIAINLVFGHSNQMFFFVGALSGTSSYLCAIILREFGISPWITLVPAALLMGAIGMVVSYASARRKFGVVAISIITLTIQLAFRDILIGAREITGGSTGLGFRGLSIGPVEDLLGVDQFFVLYCLLIALLFATVGIYRWIMSSKYGIALNAIRQDEEVAEYIGIDVLRYKSYVGFVSAFIIGIIGPFYAQLSGFVVPSMYSLASVDIIILVILLVGGLRTTLGPLIGAAGIVYIDQSLSSLGQWRSIVFGTLLVFLFLYFRRGVVPAARSIIEDHIPDDNRIDAIFD